jgi:hypothetical protein
MNGTSASETEVQQASVLQNSYHQLILLQQQGEGNLRKTDGRYLLGLYLVRTQEQKVVRCALSLPVSQIKIHIG